MTITSSYLDQYQQALNGRLPVTAAISFYAALDTVASVSPEIAAAILQELKDQRRHLKLIASENYCSLAVQQAMGNLLTDKYAEGIPGSRFYAGCENIDLIESKAAQLARQLFQADHAYVQPHSGADANLVAFLAVLAARVQPQFLQELHLTDLKSLSEEQFQQLRTRLGNQKLLALDIGSGGHLTHGYRLNISAQLFVSHHYNVSKLSGLLDYEQIRQLALEVKPLILLAGYSAYPRKIDFARMRAIADEVGAVLMVDMAHFAGLVAGKVFTNEFNPIPFADIITSTTHKTLRGPRGGLILCQKWLAEYVDKGCPMVLGGPLPMVMAAKAIAFQEALRPQFADYAAQVVKNAQALASELQNRGVRVLTGGTDNHLLQINVFESFGLTGRQAEQALRECGLTVNRNALPFDSNGVWYTSGLRLGTPAITTLGMTEPQMAIIADILVKSLQNTKPQLAEDGSASKAKYLLEARIRDQSKAQVEELLNQFKLYPELILE